MEDMKQCSVKSGCGEWKELSAFTKGRGQCKSCRAKLDKIYTKIPEIKSRNKKITDKWRKENKEKVAKYNIKYNKKWGKKHNKKQPHLTSTLFKQVVHTCKRPPKQKVHTCKRPPSLPYMEKTYGLTNKDYEKLLKDQSYSCGSCGITEEKFIKIHSTDKRKLTRLFIDHDHITGKVRGLLCDKCNRGIGLLKDSIIGVKQALEYLQNK